MIEQLGQRLYSRKEVAEMLHIGVYTVRMMTYDGRLERVRVGRSVYVTEASIKDYLAGNNAKKRTTRLTYDVHFDDDNSSNAKGWKLTKKECVAWIETNIGTNWSYFADYKGGVVSVVCNETGATVYQRLIPNERRYK